MNTASRQVQAGGFFVYNQAMSASLGLFRLQQVDSRINAVEARLSAIGGILENDAELQAARGQVQTAETETNNSEKNWRNSELEAQSQQIKIQQAEASLYGGSVHNPKELQDLQADVASLKKHLAVIEDQELDAMQGVESAQAGLAAARENLVRIEARLAEDHHTLIMEQEKLQRDLEDLQTERNASVQALASEDLKRYEALRQERRGVAVAGISDNSCQACGTVLTAALQQNARHATQLIFCPSCGRILFAS